MIKIDAHHHFWQPDRGDYGWMPQDDAVLSRAYGPVDLAPELLGTGITKTVLVQAAPTVAETEFLLGIADSTPHIAALVGWINFEDPGQIDTLKQLAQHPKFVGVRPMIQDLPDDDWMLRDEVQWAYRAILDLDLTFDCLGYPRHLANFRTLLTRYPGMRAVLDHCMKPQIGGRNEKNFSAWAEGMARLAQDTAVWCKLSGLVTEAGKDWSPQALKPFSDHVLAVFGAERVMWGSDWPVCRLACEYQDWHQTAQGLTRHLDETQKARVFGESAAEFYRI